MSEVVWVDTTSTSFDNTVRHKLRRLIDTSGATAELSEGMRVALKINTAEEGYDYGLRPEFIRVVADAVTTTTQTRPVVCDGLKLIDYWKKAWGNNFMKLASSQGLSTETLGGHFVINGGFSGDEGDLDPGSVSKFPISQLLHRNHNDLHRSLCNNSPSGWGWPLDCSALYILISHSFFFSLAAILL